MRQKIFVQNINSKTASSHYIVYIGMRDFGPSQMAVRDMVFDKVKNVFKRHGAQAIDTPVCELKEILTDKYGDESKLIYELQDQGGELLALRYDLTVPFARYLAQNKIQNLKRYQIAKVYRRDNPSPNQGRFREFYQCDFDIAGTYEDMMPDSECVKMVYEILNDLELKSFVVKVNHREILNGIFEVCEIPVDKFKTVCSSIDKMDKMSWEEIKKELVEVKQISEESVKKIYGYVQRSGKGTLLDELLNSELATRKETREALESLKLFDKYCTIFKIDHAIEYDLSLARGLDYYDAIIFEVKLTSKEFAEMGSLAAGGRYDSLVTQLSSPKSSDLKNGGDSKDKTFKVPCVGISLGIERVLYIVEKQLANEGRKLRSTQCFICSVGPEMIDERLKLINDFWAAGIRAEHSYKAAPKLLQQFKTCEDRNIPFCVIIGRNEVDNGVVKLRNLVLREEKEIPRAEIIEELKSRLAKL